MTTTTARQAKKTTTRTPSTSYGAEHLTHLNGLEAVRKRPGMFIGSPTDGTGLTHLVYEIVDNAVDEALAGHCTHILIHLTPAGAVTVTDNGRGIPTNIHPDSNLSGVELVFTELHAGGKFTDKGGYAVSGGLHGVGASVVNALSERLDVTVRQRGQVHEMSFQRGTPGKFSSTRRNATFTPTPGLRAVRPMRAIETTGTTVTFHPDPLIFPTAVAIDTDAVLRRAQQTAFLIPNLKIVVKTPDGTSHVFKSAGGTVDMVTHLTTSNTLTPLTAPIHLTGSGEFTETVPVVSTTSGALTNAAVERHVDVDVAFTWVEDTTDMRVSSFVNIVSTPNHGTHVKGFEKAITSEVRKAFAGTRILKAGEEQPTTADMCEGLVAVVAVRVPEPQFHGQTKDELGTAAVTKIVTDVVSAGFATWVGKNRTKARAVLTRIAETSRARVAAKQQREASRRKTALKSAAMPAKLVDCRSPGVAGSELFLVEGDSALGSCRAARNSEFQALLPLRGKILNVHRATPTEALRNAECAAITQVLGAGMGTTFDLSQARYERVLLMVDADVDGSHIRVLLISLFHKYFRDLITAGRLYVAVPPLHKIETVGSRTHNPIYTYTQEQMEHTVADLRKAGKQVRTPIQRFKGLGEMGAGELWDTAMNPATRKVRRVTLDDAAHATEVLNLLLGNDVEPRRNWLIDNATRITMEELS